MKFLFFFKFQRFQCSRRGSLAKVAIYNTVDDDHHLHGGEGRKETSYFLFCDDEIFEFSEWKEEDGL